MFHRFRSYLTVPVVVGIFALPPQLFAGSQGTGASQANLLQLADTEIIRRQENLVRAQRLIEEARKALREKEFEQAYVYYLDAVELIPPGEAAGKIDRQRAVNEFSAAAVQYAEYLISHGRFSEAEQVAKTVLLPRFNPTYRPAIQLLSNLEQPDYYNKTITPQFARQRDEVVRLLQEAEGYYASGRYDLATRRYNQVLEIDPYNSAARRGMETVDRQRQEYYTSAYNQTRSEMLWEVSKAWETPVVRSDIRDDDVRREREERGTEAIFAKLNRIIIPRISLEDTTLREAVDFLQQQSRRLDTTVPDEAQRGVNIILRTERTPEAVDPDDPAPTPTAATRINLQLNHVPLYEALRYVAELAGLRVRVEPFAVSLVPLSEPAESLITKEYRVPAGFIPPTAPEERDDPFRAIGIQTGARRPGPGIGARLNAQRFLEDNGVTFPPGASATYIPTGSKLIVRNTPDNIDLIDNLVNATVGITPTQVKIESKFLEISQNDLSELGFDWLLGPVALPGQDAVYLSGGDTRVNANAFPFSTQGQYAVTDGLRSGVGSGNAISTSTLEGFLAGAGAAGAAPGFFGISGIFTNPQFQVLIRALDQRKGVDLLSAPHVTTKSGQRANVRIVRKFFYPTQFDPPIIPASTGTGTGSTVVPVNPLLRPPPTVTPSFPSAFEERDIGVILEVEPIVGPDSYTIDLNLTPEVVEFDGFINYGSPLTTVGYAPAGPGEIVDAIIDATVPPLGFLVPISQVLTDNVINQPIFSVRKVTTSVTIWDGQTVALGGLMREDSQKVEDKVPILGDIPLAGRLFRSNVDQTIKRNLVIFVTATIIDAEGRPIRRDDLDEEFVDPLGLPQALPGPSFPTMKGGGRLPK